MFTLRITNGEIGHRTIFIADDDFAAMKARIDYLQVLVRPRNPDPYTMHRGPRPWDPIEKFKKWAAFDFADALTRREFKLWNTIPMRFYVGEVRIYEDQEELLEHVWEELYAARLKKTWQQFFHDAYKRNWDRHNPPRKQSSNYQRFPQTDEKKGDYVPIELENSFLEIAYKFNPDSSQDPRAVLASRDDAKIKKFIHKLLLNVHPDKHGGSEASKVWTQIVVAFKDAKGV